MNILIMISILALLLTAGCGGGSAPTSADLEQQDVVATILDPDDKLIQQEDQQMRLEEERGQQIALLAEGKNLAMDEHMMPPEDPAPIEENPDLPGATP